MSKRGWVRVLVAVLTVVGAAALAAVATAKDTTGPTRPTGLTPSSTTADSIAIKWNASTDNVGVTGYRVYRNGTLVTTTTARSYTLVGLKCGTAYVVSVVARDAAGNQSLPATILPRTLACAPATPPCPTPSTVLSLLLEHKIEYGCGWPDGWAARPALKSIRAFLALREPQLSTWRAEKWHGIVLDELDAAADDDAAWTSNGVLTATKAGRKVQVRIGRAIRLLHWSNHQLWEVSKAEKWGLTALSWYMSASEFNARTRAGADPDVLAGAKEELERADQDFFGSNVYRAWGRYRQAWEQVTGIS